MTTETKVLGTIFILTVVLLFGGIFFLSRGSSTSTPASNGPVLQIDYSKGQKIGSDSAKVKLVEFSDLQCPACFAAESFVKRIREAYPQEVLVIYRHFPLPQHSHGREAAYLAESAGEAGKFWQMHDKLFETQAQWSALTDATPFFLDLAKQLGLDENKVKQEISTDIFKAKIDAEVADGNRLGVNSTPSFFLNGRKLNLQNFSDMITAVENELKKSSN